MSLDQFRSGPLATLSPTGDVKRAAEDALNALDEMLGDTDLDGDDSPEFRAHQALRRFLDTAAFSAMATGDVEREARELLITIGHCGWSEETGHIINPEHVQAIAQALRQRGGAWRDGAEAMREACAKEVHPFKCGICGGGEGHAKRLRSLPAPPSTDTKEG